MEKPHLTKDQRLSNALYNPKNLQNIPAIRWGVDHEYVALIADQRRMGRVVKHTGIWMFHNNSMGVSPDGPIFSEPHSGTAVGIIEVNCPYPLRDT